MAKKERLKNCPCNEEMACDGDEVTVSGYIQFLNTDDDRHRFFLCADEVEPGIGDVIGNTLAFIQVNTETEDEAGLYGEIFINQTGESDPFSDEVVITAEIVTWDAPMEESCNKHISLILHAVDDFEFVDP